MDLCKNINVSSIGFINCIIYHPTSLLICGGEVIIFKLCFICINDDRMVLSVLLIQEKMTLILPHHHQLHSLTIRQMTYLVVHCHLQNIIIFTYHVETVFQNLTFDI